MSINIETPAPAFTLFNSEKQEVSLSQFLGKNVVLLFYPQAYTSVCTEELCMVRDNLRHYEALNAEILAISVDSVFTLDHWKQEQGYNFHMLSDFNKEVSRDYESIYETFAFGMKGVSKRAAFVIDAQGILKHKEILENAGELPNLDAIKSILAAL